jgi:protoporphyrinogen/coproporphyrinogen III oxidase
VGGGRAGDAESVSGRRPGELSSAGQRQPVFGTLRGGMGVLVDRLVELARADVRLGGPVREVSRTGDGWRVEVGSPGRADVLLADAVVLAVPPPAARRLLVDVAPVAAAAFGRVGVGSVAVLSVAFPDGVRLPESSGVLLAVGERRSDGTPFTAKAFTHTSVKWASGPPRLRASIGRVGETALLRRDDEDLLAAVLGDLAELSGVRTPPIDWRITRWGGGLPQYGVEHVAAVDAIERAVGEVPGLAVAGASFRGVGIPACVDAATAAAERVAAHLLAHTDAG